MTEMIGKARPLAAWMDALSDIDRSLAQSLEQTPQPPAQPATPPFDDDPLEKLDHCLVAWQNALGSAQRHADVAGGAVEAEEKALADWCEKVERVRLLFSASMQGSPGAGPPIKPTASAG